MINPGVDKTHILVVDDEPAICQFCQRVLTEEGFEVDIASGGRAAQSMISKQDYDLYLFDIKMPLMDGKKLYDSLQKTDPRITSRVVFTTGSAIGQDTERFLQSSGRPLLPKPFTTEELKAIITQAFKAVDK